MEQFGINILRYYATKGAAMVAEDPEEIMLELNHLAYSRQISLVDYTSSCGGYYGYDPCCVKNYINLTMLGEKPAKFMRDVLGHKHHLPYVLCNTCYDNLKSNVRKEYYNGLNRHN